MGGKSLFHLCRPRVSRRSWTWHHGASGFDCSKPFFHNYKRLVRLLAPPPRNALRCTSLAHNGWPALSGRSNRTGFLQTLRSDNPKWGQTLSQLLLEMPLSSIKSGPYGTGLPRTQCPLTLRTGPFAPHLRNKPPLGNHFAGHESERPTISQLPGIW